MNREQALKILTQYPEFAVLKKELLKFVSDLDDLSTINLKGSAARLSVAEEVAGRQYASEKVKSLLKDLGIISNTNFVEKHNTYE